MRVLMVSDYFPPHHGGGVEVVVYEVARRLVDRGHQVRVITLNTTDSPSEETIEGIEIRRYRSVQLTKLIRLQLSVPRTLWSDLNPQLREFKPDLINAHNIFFTSSLLAALRFGHRPPPFVTTVHLGNVDALGGWKRHAARWYERGMGKLVLDRSDFVIGVSRATIEHVATLHSGIRSAVVPNGVDLDRFRPASSSPQEPATDVNGVFVGRLIVNKGPQFLMEAMASLAPIHPNLKLVMVGDGPLAEDLVGTARAAGIIDRVEFLGLRQDVDEVMRRADFFVRPSLVEGMPLTVLEAMATGLPVIASDVAGTGEVIVDGQSGLLVEPGDVAGLVEAMDRVVRDRALRTRLGSGARRRVEEAFSWDATTDQVEEIFGRLVGGGS